MPNRKPILQVLPEILFLCVFLLVTANGAFAQTGPEKRCYETRGLDGGAITLDGRPDEPAWDTVPWSGGFIQRSPFEAKPPSEATELKILHDGDALYVAFRAWDREVGKIERQLARRDWFPGDWVEINIDSRGDRRTAFSFTTSVSGVRGDEYVSEDGNVWDASWDPVWRAATAIDSAGWTAEVRIPFSQLRYDDREEQVWGIQATRRIFRHDERSVWQFVPEDSPGWVSRFGELRGIHGIRAPRRIELLPYVVGSIERFQRAAGNPFLDGGKEDLDAGLDGKVGLSGNMVLDFTVNPDFGQVEADPSQVNLTAFETFFEERRPFFIEGSETFRYRLSEAVTGGAFTSDRLFYSRRIGRAPRGAPELGATESVDVPTATGILGAAKLAGKTPSGFSIGLLDAVTAEAEAEIGGGPAARREVVEPRTNYFAGRAEQSFGGGSTLLGGMFTAAHRRNVDPVHHLLHSGAFAGGIDFEQRWRERMYHLKVRLLASDVRGTTESMIRTQTAAARYFQRPDAGYVSVDSTRRSLAGNGGSIYAGKGNGRWRYQTGCTWRSPGLELNDLGYLRSADEINQSSWVGYYITRPFSIFHEFSINGNQWLGWDFGGNNILRQLNLNTHETFRNRWGVSASVTRVLERRSNVALRGGPALLLPASWEVDGSVSTDERRPYGAEFGYYASRDGDGDAGGSSVSCELNWRPTSQVQVRLTPEYQDFRTDLQYLERHSFAGESRFLMADLRQRTALATLRLDGCVTPNLTVQYYAQPFLSSGRYTQFKRITRPDADRYQDRFQTLAEGTSGPDRISYDPAAAVYAVDEDGDGGSDYEFDDPDFNYKAFQSNLVVRWEYRPGSTLFVVWSQSREGSRLDRDLALGRDAERLFGLHPHNVFLVKVSRWLSW